MPQLGYGDAVVLEPYIEKPKGEPTTILDDAIKLRQLKTTPKSTDYFKPEKITPNEFDQSKIYEAAYNINKAMAAGADPETLVELQKEYYNRINEANTRNEYYKRQRQDIDNYSPWVNKSKAKALLDETFYNSSYGEGDPLKDDSKFSYFTNNTLYEPLEHAKHILKDYQQTRKANDSSYIDVERNVINRGGSSISSVLATIEGGKINPTGKLEEIAMEYRNSDKLIDKGATGAVRNAYLRIPEPLRNRGIFDIATTNEILSNIPQDKLEGIRKKLQAEGLDVNWGAGSTIDQRNEMVNYLQRKDNLILNRPLEEELQERAKQKITGLAGIQITTKKGESPISKGGSGDGSESGFMIGESNANVVIDDKNTYSGTIKDVAKVFQTTKSKLGSPLTVNGVLTDAHDSRDGGLINSKNQAPLEVNNVFYGIRDKSGKYLGDKQDIKLSDGSIITIDVKDKENYQKHKEFIKSVLGWSVEPYAMVNYFDEETVNRSSGIGDQDKAKIIELTKKRQHGDMLSDEDMEYLAKQQKYATTAYVPLRRNRDLKSNILSRLPERGRKQLIEYFKERDNYYK